MDKMEEELMAKISKEVKLFKQNKNKKQFKIN